MSKEIKDNNKLWDEFLENFTPEIIKCINTAPQDYINAMSDINDTEPHVLRSLHVYSPSLIEKYRDKLVMFNQPVDIQKNGNYCGALQFSKEDHVVFTSALAIKNKVPLICIYINVFSYKNYEFCLNFPNENKENILHELYEDDRLGFNI